jgi:hypothetical protein
VADEGDATLLDWSLDVPDHFAQHIAAVNWAKAPTVYTVNVSPDYVNLVFVKPHAVHLLDHGSIFGVTEGDDIACLDRSEKIGDFGHKHKIPITKSGQQAIACYPKQLQH